MKKNIVVGIDYGTDSCRALVMDALTGKELATSVKYYPRWKKGLFCNSKKDQYRQHPLDYIETLEESIREALSNSPEGTAQRVAGIAFDMTGSTPVIINKDGIPLSLCKDFEDNPNAMFVLWKDHTAIKESIEINELAKKWDIDYTAYEGGIYSAEWVWSKVLHVLRDDEKVRKEAYSWVEHTDWIPGLITGNTKPETMIRSRCAAGHKAMWHESWDGLPSEEFLTTLSPLLSGFRKRLFTETYPADKKVGYLTKEWSERLGLPQETAVAVGAMDCHVGAVGAGIKPGSFVCVMGTSTCDIMVVPYDEMGHKLIPGICGQVDGSVLPGYIGLEAGQSAFGDIYAWFKKVLEWPLNSILAKTEILDDSVKNNLLEVLSDAIIPELSKEAAIIAKEESTVIAIDWFNGRRTPDANQLLKGSITGLTLGSSAPLIFRALVEATAFGSKAIVERFIENNIEIKEVIAIGGISQKSPLVMQILSDVLGMHIKVANSEQTCALGACMFAAVAGNVYSDIKEAQDKISRGFNKTYIPNSVDVDFYSNKYKKYLELGRVTESVHV